MFPPWSNIDVIEKSFEKSLGSFERDDIIDMEKRREKLSAMRRQVILFLTFINFNLVNKHL